MTRRALTASMLLPVVLLACDDGDDKAATTDSPTTAAPTTEAPTTSEAPTTTAAPTTEAPTTTEAPAEGWTTIDPTTVSAPLALPCCASNWFGEPSPALPEPGGTLEDGVYRVMFTWPTDFGEPIDATVQRFAPCGELPAGSCEPEGADGVTYLPDSMGVDESESFQYELQLDGDLAVVLGGFNGFEDGSGNAAQGTGADLAALLEAVDADYADLLGDRLAAGEDPYTVMQDALANPTGGFEATEFGELRFVANGAPGLLFQAAVYRDDPTTARGSDVVKPISLVIEDGQPTLIVYGGFYS